jgi:hypothetical protein
VTLCAEIFPDSPRRSASAYSYQDRAIDGTFSEIYHSLACHELVTVAAVLAYSRLDRVSSSCTNYAQWTFQQLQQCHSQHTKVGYCSNTKMDETGETALFAANLTNLLHMRMSESGIPVDYSIQLLHQGQLHTSYFDIGWYLADPHSRYSFPFAIIEYTKNRAPDKLAPLRAYVNLMYHASTVSHGPQNCRSGWIPMLAIKLSHSEIIYSVVCITRVPQAEDLKFVEIPLCTEVFNVDQLLHMMHVLYQWHLAVLQFFSAFHNDATPSSGVHEILRHPKIHERLLLERESNHVKIRGRDGVLRVAKVYDYRSVVSKAWILDTDRRSPDAYAHSTLDYEELCNWTGRDPRDKLRIIQYAAVSGDHVPCNVGHMTAFIAELAEIHRQGIVHGDLRFSNVVFYKPDTASYPGSSSSSGASSSSSSSSTSSGASLARIIDFDLSGRAGEKVYPSGFNLQINDGKRHPDVKDLSHLQFEHDIYAAVWMLQQYRPKAAHLHESWTQAVDILMKNSVDEFINMMSKLSSEELEAVSGLAIVDSGRFQ